MSLDLTLDFGWTINACPLFGRRFSTVLTFIMFRNYRRISDRKNLTIADLVDLPYLLSITRTFKATNPKDGLYALLGIDEARDVVVVPDYSKTVSEVYLEFVAQCI